MDENLIAPCGMNCSLCSGYLAWKLKIREKGIRMPYCSGCRPRNKQCAFLKKRCPSLMTNSFHYCWQCQGFPCSNLLGLDKRYRTNFRMSMIENLKFIEQHGITKFLINESEKWQCPNCRGTICCHNGICFECDLEKLKTRDNHYRWE